MDEEKKEEIVTEEAKPEAHATLDIADIAMRLKATGVEGDKIMAVFQSAKEDGKISDEDLAKVMAVLKEEGGEEVADEQEDAEKAFGMKFLD